MALVVTEPDDWSDSNNYVEDTSDSDSPFIDEPAGESLDDDD